MSHFSHPPLFISAVCSNSLSLSGGTQVCRKGNVHQLTVVRRTYYVDFEAYCAHDLRRLPSFSLSAHVVLVGCFSGCCSSGNLGRRVAAIRPLRHAGRWVMPACNCCVFVHTFAKHASVFVFAIDAKADSLDCVDPSLALAQSRLLLWGLTMRG